MEVLACSCGKKHWKKIFRTLVRGHETQKELGSLNLFTLEQPWEGPGLRCPVSGMLFCPLLMGLPLSSGCLALGRGAVYTLEPEVRVAENKRECGASVEGGVWGRREQVQAGIQHRLVVGAVSPSRLLLLLPPVHFWPVCSRQVVLLLLRLLLSPCGVEVCPRGRHQPRLL